MAADAARQCQYRVILATSGYERPELLRWRLDQAQGDARRVVIATLTPPKGIKDRRQVPTDEEITERLSMLYHLIEATGDPQSGMLPETSVVNGPLSVATSVVARSPDLATSGIEGLPNRGMRGDLRSGNWQGQETQPEQDDGNPKSEIQNPTSDGCWLQYVSSAQR